jgi:hypothetical protein
MDSVVNHIHAMKMKLCAFQTQHCLEMSGLLLTQTIFALWGKIPMVEKNAIL